MINKINKQTIRNNTNLPILGLLNNKSSNSSYIKVWTASPKLSLSLLRNSLCYLKTFYCNGLYFTMSPVVFICGEGNPALIFENKLRRAESNLKESKQTQGQESLKNCLKDTQNDKKGYSNNDMELKTDNKIKLCLPCFEDTDLKKDDVIIITENECVENQVKELKEGLI